MDFVLGVRMKAQAVLSLLDFYAKIPTAPPMEDESNDQPLESEIERDLMDFTEISTGRLYPSLSTLADWQLLGVDRIQLSPVYRKPLHSHLEEPPVHRKPLHSPPEEAPVHYEPSNHPLQEFQKAGLGLMSKESEKFFRDIFSKSKSSSGRLLFSYTPKPKSSHLQSSNLDK